MRRTERIHFYEYMDIIDSRNKLEELEKKGENKNKYSWIILVDELKNKVVTNEFIEDFIKKVNKNIKFSDIYYNTINKYIDETMEEINKENNEHFYILQKLMLLYYLDNNNFYLLQKDKIYQEMMIINKLYMKINETYDPNKINILNKILCKNLEIFEKRKKVLGLIIKKNNILSYDIDFIININANDNNHDIIKYFDFIKYNNLVYNNVTLPSVIKIEEKNQYSLSYNNFETKIIDYIYILKPIINYTNEDKNINADVYHKYIFINYSYIITRELTVNIMNKFYIYSHYFDKWRKKHKT